jgi:hypothetical protein
MIGVALRKSPVRTRAMLAANRANAQKSTGPSTPESKARVALSALRHGANAPGFLCNLGKSARAREEYKELYLALYAALLPDKTDQTAVDLLQRTALHVWTLKQRAARWAASRAERDAWFAKTGGLLPPPVQLLIRRPGWRVRVSVWVRRGRGRGHRRLLQTGAGWEEGRARLHVVVTVTASIGHPLLGCTSLEEIPEGMAPRLVFKLKPECHRKQNDCKNVIGLSRIRQGTALVASAHHHDDPISRHIASTTGDLLSWLHPENVVLTGARLSEAEDIKSWIEAIVTKWEKEHGPIPKKELLPHEIGRGLRRWQAGLKRKPEYVGK